MGLGEKAVGFGEKAVGLGEKAGAPHEACLAAGLPAGWKTPSTRSGSAPVFSRQCG